MENWHSAEHRPPSGMHYGPPYGYSRGMNGLAVVSLVSVFVFPPLAVILGHMARQQIRRSGESGAGIALGALIIGYVVTAIVAVLVLVALSQASKYSA
jgi:Domain of unknown function (DUF4190)